MTVNEEQLGGGWGHTHLTGWTAEQQRVSLTDWSLVEPAVCQLIYERFRPKSVLDIGCFVAGTHITMGDGSQLPIEDVREGDTVLTHASRPRRVARTFVHEVMRTISIRSPYGYSMRCTEDHPLLVVRRKNVLCHHNRAQVCNTHASGFCSACGRRPFASHREWAAAGTVRAGDFLTVHRPPRATGGSSRVLARLLGYYLAEGHVLYSHRPLVCGLGFTFHIDETGYREEVKDLATALGATSTSIHMRPESKQVEVHVYGKSIAEQVIALGGKLSHGKRLAREVFTWQNEAKLDIVACWLRGDGCYRDNPGRGVALCGKTVSLDLANDLCELLRDIGILCGFAVDMSGKSPAYVLVLSGEDVAPFTSGRCYTSKRRYRKDEQFFYVPVIDLEVHDEPTPRMVFNLGVEDDNTYIANGLVVHNCGTGKWLAEFEKLGATDLVGIEPLPEVEGLFREVGPKKYQFIAADATQLLRLGRTFDLVICLEVIEHVIPEGTDALVENITSYAPHIIFSGAGPETVDTPTMREGKEIFQHINARPEREYADMLLKRGFCQWLELSKEMVRLSTNPWYQQNIRFYANYPEPRSLSYNAFLRRSQG